MLANAAAMKSKVVKEGAFRLLSACALRYQHLEAISAAVIDLVNKQEHLSGVMAELAEFAAAAYDNRLVGCSLHFNSLARRTPLPLVCFVARTCKCNSCCFMH